MSVSDLMQDNVRHHRDHGTRFKINTQNVQFGAVTPQTQISLLDAQKAASLAALENGPSI